MIAAYFGVGSDDKNTNKKVEDIKDSDVDSFINMLAGAGIKEAPHDGPRMM